MNPEHVGGPVLAAARELHGDPHQWTLELGHDQCVHVDGAVALQAPRVGAESVEHKRLERVGALVAGRSRRWRRRSSLPVQAVVQRIPQGLESLPPMRVRVKPTFLVLGEG